MTTEERRQFSNYWINGTAVFSAITAGICWRYFRPGKVPFPLNDIAHPYTYVDNRLVCAMGLVILLFVVSLVVLWVLENKIIPNHHNDKPVATSDFQAGVTGKWGTGSGFIKIRALGLLGAFATIFVLAVVAILVLIRWGWAE